jgi:hypothetical protein
MQCACFILSSVACRALQQFSTLSYKWYDLRKIIITQKCVFWFSLQLLSETFPILRRTERDMIKNVYWSSCEVPVILVFMLSTRYSGLHVKYPLFWSSCEVPVILVFMWSTRYSCKVLTKLEFSWQIFEKFSNVKFHEIPSSGSRVVLRGWTDRRTDGHSEANSRF